MQKIFYVDGGTSNNGGVNQDSFICVTNDKGKPIIYERIGDKTNNEAELTAILRLLKKTKSKNPLIYSDSQLAVNLVNGKWKTEKPHLMTILKDIWFLKKTFSLNWLRRDNNKAGFVLQERLGL